MGRGGREARGAEDVVDAYAHGVLVDGEARSEARCLVAVGEGGGLGGGGDGNGNANGNGNGGGWVSVSVSVNVIVTVKNGMLYAVVAVGEGYVVEVAADDDGYGGVADEVAGREVGDDVGLRGVLLC